MPPQPNDLHTANNPSLEDSSDDQAETIPVPVEHQGIAKHDTPSSDNSDSDNSKPNQPLLDLNNINKMNINILRNMLTQSTLRKRAKISLYKLPSKRCAFLHEVAQLNDALKDTPKLTTKNWYAWNPRFWDILATWSPALKHLDGITKPGDRKIHKLYYRLKKDLTKMEHIAESTLLYEASKIHMFNADVRKFSTDLDEHWAKAETMGFNLTQVLKIKTLINQAKFVTNKPTQYVAPSTCQQSTTGTEQVARHNEQQEDQGRRSPALA
ncbi:uncharacterized protein UHOD_12286 [Ustilago sp. UG-2017b]|nr:uncharacterized protein UHOD_12286 [Ustilago sp. UG-2017b]